MSKRAVKNRAIENLNVMTIDMTNVIVVLIMTEMDTMMMRVYTLAIMTTQGIFTTIYFLNTIHNTLTMTEPIEEDTSNPIIST